MTSRGRGRLSVVSSLDRDANEASLHKDRTADDSEFGGVDLPEVLPAGAYLATAVDWDIYPAHGKHSLSIFFEVRVPDDQATDGVRYVTLRRHYNVRWENGRWKPSPYGDYTREWILVTGRRAYRSDRMTPRVFIGVLVRVEVVVVTEDRLGNDLPANARYSKIARIIEVVADEAPL